MRPITVQVGPLAAPSANNIALSQTPSGTTALTLNGSLVSGGVATLDTPRRVLVTVSADESAKTLTFTGTTFANSPVTETLAMPASGMAYTVLDYKTVTSIVPSGSFAGAITVGTNGVASSAWIAFDAWAAPNITFQANASGTVNYTAQQTVDDPNSPTNAVAPASVKWVNASDVISATGISQSYYPFVPAYGRILLNSQTNPGYVTATYLQAGNVPL